MTGKYFLFIISLCCLIIMPGISPAARQNDTTTLTPCFTPGHACTDRIISEIDAARSEVLVQAYSFTSAQIAKALVDAHRRGVKVQAILDRSQRTAKYSYATFLANMRVPTYIDAEHAIAHNKIIIIDGIITITGSFNFTKAAQDRNAENLLVIRSRDIAHAYRENWANHLKHSEKYEPRY